MLHLRLCRRSLHSNELAGLQVLAPRAHEPSTLTPRSPSRSSRARGRAPLPALHPPRAMIKMYVQARSSCLMQSRPIVLGAANTLRDMPACPSAPVARLRVQCKSSQRGYHKLIRILASRPRWPEGVASSPHPPHPSCKRGRVPPTCLHTCVALSESDFWGILLNPPLRLACRLASLVRVPLIMKRARPSLSYGYPARPAGQGILTLRPDLDQPCNVPP